MSVGEQERRRVVARARRSRRRDVVGGAGVLAVVVFVVWSLVAVHAGGPIWDRQEHHGRSTVCAPDPLDGPGDLTQRLPVSLPGDITLLGVRLVGSHGLRLVEADVDTVAPTVDAVGMAPTTEAGWPALDGSLAPVQGVRIDGGSFRTLVLHLALDEPSQQPGFDDVAIVYRSSVFRYQAPLGITSRYVPDGTACPG